MGEAGERTCRGYTADFCFLCFFFFWLFLCLSFLVCQGKALPHEIHNARTNKHASGPWSCLNTARTCCHSPPAFGYTLLYTHTHGLPLPVHNHTHTQTHAACGQHTPDMTKCCVRRELSPVSTTPRPCQTCLPPAWPPLPVRPSALAG